MVSSDIAFRRRFSPTGPNGFRHSTRAFLFGSVAAFASPLAAQQPPRPDVAQNQTTQQPTAPAGNDIVVTASGRAQRLQEIPVSAVVIGPEQLQRTNINDVADLSRGIANVSAYGSNKNSQTFAIRGIAALTGAYTGSPYNTFGIYLDGLNLSPIRFQQQQFGGDASNSGLFEVERVEVLRGPQGTYFGRNVLGGAISIISKKPTNKFEGQVSARVSSFKGREAQGMINVPIFEGLALRVSGRYYKTDGPVKNLGPGIRWSSLPSVAAPATFPKELRDPDRFGKDSSSSVENESVRAALRWQPSGWLTLDLTGQYDNERYGITPTTQSGIFATDTGALPPNFPAVYGGVPVDPLNLGTYFSGNTKRAAYSGANSTWLRGPRFSANVAMQLDPVSIELITSYRRLTLNYVTDRDQTLARGTQSFDGIVKSVNFSQEARATYDSEHVKFLLGGFYARDKEDGFTVQYTEGPRPEGLLLDTTPRVSTYTFAADDIIGDKTPRHYHAYAAFGEFTYVFNEHLEATAGLRYSVDQTDGAGFDITSSGNPTSYVYYLEPFDITTKKLTYRGSVKYRFSDRLNLYGTVSSGHRPGIPNLGNSVLTTTGNLVNVTAAQLGVPNVLRPEELTNYEIGLKSRPIDGLSLNVAAFYERYKDIQGPSQVSVLVAVPNALDPTLQLGVNSNLGGADVKGVEAEVQWRSGSGLHFEGSFGVLKTKLDNFVVIGVGAVGGRKLPLARPWSATGRAYYDFTIGRVDASFGGELQTAGRTARYLNAYTPGQTNPLDYLPKIEVVNTFLNLRAGDSWSIDAVVENVFAKRYWTSVTGLSIRAGYFLDVNPRTFSIRLGRRF